LKMVGKYGLYYLVS